ncbi:uncharacterized protein BYT42DRAFT_569364 [Radiomyces spectabilis]|uniref:uncharacterized protein n=1 Tax=Radiomyces spectabilis TaxID=64574 RepID=UPI002220D678|nr:uncharacterized protein BYT42DRAFT_569364 [Radiomyces spectabilis]KAI8379602.1 hypothetical protein BYT42DRAFT_569364 [Radiomyces spectabilis]
MLVQLPDEILLCIIHHLKSVTCIDLISVASTCRRLRHLVGDWTLWSDNISITTAHASNEMLDILTDIFTDSSLRRYGIKSLAMIINRNDASVCQFLAALLGQQQHDITCSSLRFEAPWTVHDQLLGLLSQQDAGLKSIREVSVSDPDQVFSTLSDMSRNPVMDWLVHCQSSLEIFNVASLPADWLLYYIPRKDLQFPKLASLTLALRSFFSLPATEESRQCYWQQFKHVFPNLRHLTLHVAPDDATCLIKTLLHTKSLFPWIQSITIVSPSDLKQVFPPAELRAILSNLTGLTRVNVGWDMMLVC